MHDESKKTEKPPGLQRAPRRTAGKTGVAPACSGRRANALQGTAELHSTLIESSPDPMILYNLQGELITANQRAADIYGVPTVKDLLTEVKTVFDFLAEEKPAVQTCLQRLSDGAAPQKSEYAVTLHSGTILIAELHSSLVRAADGKPRAFISVARDVTERKQREEEMHRSEERYRTILEDIDEGYFENDLEGNLTFVNDSMCRHLGYAREELIGMNYKQYNGENTIQKVRNVFAEIFRTGKPSPKYDAIYLTKNGKQHYSEASGSLMRNARGEPIGFRGIVRNIDDRKRAEQQSEKLISELQQALSKIKTLSGLLPICAYCKKIRDDEGYWNQIESYITEHSKAEFSHGICPDCVKKMYPEYYKKIYNDK